uniref:Cerebellar degeneration related protein 2 n=1 Tax=Sphaeramia orbicularis TaxID=375764 RepID=A0A673BR17_9TELE
MINYDLQLAAELGKSLLERNRELEQGLQQMYATNQEQLQEIEYLTKQVDLLRQVNDQHAKVYEQLDVSARELEQDNHKLCVDNRAAQQKIQGLTETVELLQMQVEELQHQVETLKLSPTPPLKLPHRDGGWPRSTQSVSCLKELHNTFRYTDGDELPDEPSDYSWHEEERDSLRQSLRALQAQFANERARREAAEREAELFAGENVTLEQQLTAMEGCRARLTELEHEADELRQLWKAEASLRSARPGAVHGPPEESEGGPWKSPGALKRWDSEQLLKASQTHDDDHECLCARRAQVVKYRGISLLNEVDAQYSALQVKYDALLRRCHQGLQEDQPDQQDHQQDQQAVQTSAGPALDDFSDDFHQPEYKELFREIFSRIKKTKEDLIENRSRSSAAEV